MNITLDQSVRNGPMTVSFDGRNLRVKLDASSMRVNQFLILIMKINLTFSCNNTIFISRYENLSIH